MYDTFLSLDKEMYDKCFPVVRYNIKIAILIIHG